MQRDSTRLALVAAGMALLFTLFAGTAAAGDGNGEIITVRPGPGGAKAPTYTNSEADNLTSSELGGTLDGDDYALADPTDVWGSWPGESGSYAHPTASLFPWASGQNNTLTVDGAYIAHGGTSSSTTGYILGALWQGRDHGANNNTVYIINGASVGKVYGGAAIGDVIGNTVNITGGNGTTTATQVTGGLSVRTNDGTGQSAGKYYVQNNKVYVDGTAGSVHITGIVSGGWNASGPGTNGGNNEVDEADTPVIGNRVEISGSYVKIASTASGQPANIYGGYNQGNSVTSGNYVVIKDGDINPTGDAKTQGTDQSGGRQIVGGYTSVITNNDVFDNHVQISGGNITILNNNNHNHPYVGIFGGRNNGTGTSPIINIHDNTVEITGGTITLENGVVAGTVAGNDMDRKSNVYDNAVTIGGGTIAANVAGARVSDASTAKNNKVEMSGGDVYGNVYGAYDGTSTGNANATTTGNFVTLTGGTVLDGGSNYNGDGSVYGGMAYGGDANVNTVTISGATVQNGDVYGGQTKTGKAEWNRVTISAGSVEAGDVFGGQATEAGGEAKHNTVTIQGGRVGGSAYGSHSQNTEVIGGVVNLTAGTVGGDAYGVYSGSGPVNAGEVNVAGGSVGGSAYGGWSGGDGTVNINGNTLSLTAGSIGGDAFGGASTGGNVNANTLTIAGGTVGRDVYGGKSTTGDATNNILTVGGDVAGAAYGGWSESGEANGNKVSLRGATVGGSLYGGFAQTDAADAAGNEVSLYGGTVRGWVYGNNNDNFTSAANWSTANNTLQAVSGRTDVGGVANFVTANISGGAHVNVTGSGISSGIFNDLANAGTLSFYNDTADQQIGIVHGAYTGAGKIGLDVVFNEGINPAQTDSVVFKNLPTAPITFAFNPLEGSVMAAYTKSLEGGAPEEDVPNSLFAVSEAGSLTPFIRPDQPGYGLYVYEFREEEFAPGQFNHYVGFIDDHAPDLGKVISDAGGAGVGSVGDMGTSFLMSGLDRAVRSIDVRDSYGISASIEYSGRRYDTGGRSGTADLDGVSGLVTFAHAPAGCPFSVGVFGEFYDGEYETSDTVALPAAGATPAGIYSRSARGDILNYGGGVFFQYRQHLAEALATDDFAAWSRGLHLEATARFGRSVMDMDLDLQGYAGRTSFRDKGAAYYGASLGGGYVAKPTQDSAVDFYAHGMWVRLAGSSVYDENNSIGKHIEFDKADSLRVVAGARAAYTGGDVFRPYVGVAADWEAMGRPGVFIDGVAARKADMSGLSGVLELGVGARLHERVFIDARVTGSVGKREGLAGLFEIRYEF